MPAGFFIPFVAALDWPEIIGCLVIVLILISAKKLPDFARGLGRGIEEFGKATKDVQADLDRAAGEAGQSVAGIHGKPALEALTHDNRVAEFYSIPRRDGTHSAPMTFGDKLIVFVAQGFGIGRIPFAPGTWGTLLGFVWLVLLLSSNSYWVYLFGTILGVGLAVHVCERAEKIMKQKDPGSVVLDEIVAIPVCYLLPMTFLSIIFYEMMVSLREMRQSAGLNGDEETVGSTSYFASEMYYSDVVYSPQGLVFAGVVFLFFRLFDIWKPCPSVSRRRCPAAGVW